MAMRAAGLVVSVATLVACTEPAPHGRREISDRLRDLPGVTVEEWSPPAGFDAPAGYRFFDLLVTVPIDHDDPAAGTFELYAALMHHDVDAPLVVYTSGYDAGWRRFLTEPARIVGGNQVSLEHRFYGRSRPPVVPWSRLRVDQAAADEHLVLELLRTIYDGPRIATGGSKGGETALFHHRRYPGDYDGVVAYVVPVTTGLPDLRYDGVLDRIGLPACRARLRAIGRRMLQHRDALAFRAGDVSSFTIAGADRVIETSVVELEFAFWMTRGVADCPDVPDPATAGADDLWAFLDMTSAPAAYSDEALVRYATAYLYQGHVELGYPVWNHGHLDDLMRYRYEDWSPYLPAGQPLGYDPAVALDLAAWLADVADHVLLIQGEWDPWAAGAPTIHPGRDAYQLWVPRGSHWSAGLHSLGEPDATVAREALRRWARLAPAKDEHVVPKVAPPPAPMATRGPEDDRLLRRRGWGVE